MQKISDRKRKFVEKFRQIQLMLKLHREITSKTIMLCVVLMGITINVSALYNICVMLSARDPNSDKMPWQIGFLSMWANLYDTFITMFVFVIFGKVYTISKEEQVSLGKTKRIPELRKFLLSCPVQKIYFGGFSYFESDTSLNVQDFVLNNTVSLLLLN